MIRPLLLAAALAGLLALAACGPAPAAGPASGYRTLAVESVGR